MTPQTAVARIRGWSPSRWAPALGQAPAPASVPAPRPASPLEWRPVMFVTNGAVSVLSFMLAPRLRTPVKEERREDGKTVERTVGHKMNVWSWAVYGLAALTAWRAFDEYSRIR